MGSSSASAQGKPILGWRPGDPPPAEEPESGQARLTAPSRRAPVLPEVELPAELAGPEAGASARVRVDRIEIEPALRRGDDFVETVTARYEGRALTAADLRRLRAELAAAYADAGRIASTVEVPPQGVEDGRLVVRVIESPLETIAVGTDGRLRAGYVRGPLDDLEGDPVDLDAIEERLQILLRDPRVDSVDARLELGGPGEPAALRLDVGEHTPWFAQAWTANDLPPSVGGVWGRFRAGHLDVTGHGDTLFAAYGGASGLQDVEAGYTLPFDRGRSTVGLWLRRSFIDVVEPPFDQLDIEGEYGTYSVSLTRLLFRSVRQRLELRLDGQYARADSSLLGFPFSFDPGAQDGASQVAALRVGLEWTYAGRRQAVAARSIFNVGLEALEATVNPGRAPDGQFFYWLGQFEWTARIADSGARVHARLQAQVSADPLLALEQAVVGGVGTVRGYRQNLLVRDNAVVGSIEVQRPLWSTLDGDTRLDLVAFVDAGHAWNTLLPAPGEQTIAGAGFGLRAKICRYVDVRFDWALALVPVDLGLDETLQDEGVHLGLMVSWP